MCYNNHFQKNIKIVFIEESNALSLEALEYCVKNNKHVQLDKPAGYNYEKFLIHI